MELVILAAGMGSRFGGLKQIEPIDEFGNFIIDYSIYDAIEAGFDEVTFIIKDEIYEDFKNTIGSRIEKKIKVKYAFQRTNDLPDGYVCPIKREKPWGTAHAILAARDLVKGDFAIINADDYYGKDAFKVAAKYMKSLKDSDCGKFANVTYDVCNTMTENGSVKRGVCIKNEKTGHLDEIIESKIERNDAGQIEATPLEQPEKKFIIDENQAVSMNLFVFTKDIMKELKERFPKFLKDNEKTIDSSEYLIPTVVSELMLEGKASVKLLQTSAVWHGITYRADKEDFVKSIKELVDAGQYKKGLWK